MKAGVRILGLMLVATLVCAEAVADPLAAADGAHAATDRGAPAATAAVPVEGVRDAETRAFEAIFQALLKEGDPHRRLRENQFERLLQLRYRSELYMRDFERHVASLPPRGPGDTARTPEPTEQLSYRKLQQLRAAADRQVREIEYLYRRLDALAGDPQASPAQRQAAWTILDQTHQWLDSRPEEDKLFLADLYRRLAEIAHPAQAPDAPPPARSPPTSAFSPVAPPDGDTFEQRIQARAAQIGQKAEASLAWRDPEADAEPPPAAPRRPPDTSALKIYPSAGAQGSVTGTLFQDGVFVLSFDDGPAAHSTLRLQQILKAHSDPVNPHGAPATFFCLVEQALKYPEVLAATQAAGYPINNHSWTHPNFATLAPEHRQHEIIDSTPAMAQALGHGFRFFRCPYGACVAPRIPAVREMIADQQLVHAYWRIDSLDWQNIGQPQRIADIVIRQMRATRRGIILMHDIHESSVDAAQLVLDWIRRNNASGSDLRIRLLTLEDAVDEVNGVGDLRPPAP